MRPRINRTLSPYCVELLHIGQDEIDAADDLVTVAAATEAWLRALPIPGLPTCGWGVRDRHHLAADAQRVGVPDPLAGRPHVDLEAVLGAGYRRPAIARDELRALARLPPNPRRHRALDDALDLTHFVSLLLDTRAR